MVKSTQTSNPPKKESSSFFWLAGIALDFVSKIKNEDDKY